MTDYAKITVRVNSGTYTLINKKNGRKKTKKFDIFHRPELLCGRIVKIVEIIDENTIENTKEKAMNTYVEDFKEFLSQYEDKYDFTGKLDFSIDIEIASKQTVQWCIKNLTIPQLINMGISIINVD